MHGLLPMWMADATAWSKDLCEPPVEKHCYPISCNEDKVRVTYTTVMDARSLKSLPLSLAGTASKLDATARIGCLLLGLFYVLSFFIDLLKPLAVTPGYLVPPNFWVWTLVTHPFIETNAVLLLCSAGVVSLGSITLEENFGAVKLVLFYAVVCTSSAVCSVLFYLFLYVLTSDIEYLFQVHVNGMAGLLGGILVALKQSSMDRLIIGTLGLLANDMVPLLCLLILVPLKLLKFVEGGCLLAYTSGAFSGWIYLRFYQNHSKGRGDQSEKFAFKYFFPGPVQGPIGAASEVVYTFLLRVRICHKAVYRYDVSAPSHITLTLGGVDAERQRNKAIKALDERLKKSTADGSFASPSLQDEQGTKPDRQQASAGVDHPTQKNDSEPSSLDGSASPDIVTIEIDSCAPVGNSS